MKNSIIANWPMLLVPAMCIGCGSAGSALTDAGTDTDIDTDTDTTTGPDLDTDADSDTDSDADGDSDTDSDTDTDTDTDTDADGETDGDTDTGCVDNDNDEWCEEFDCDDENADVNPGVDEVPDNGVDDDCDTMTDESPESDSDPICGEDTFDIERVPVRIMILQDVSLSMNEDDKWTQAKNALTFIVNTFNDELEFGFDRFAIAGDDLCGVGSAAIYDCQPDNAENIIEYIGGITPSNATPLYLGLENFLDASYAPIFSDPDADSYLVVISDGSDTCGLDGVFSWTEGATAEELGDITEQLRILNEIKTFVIGFGEGADEDQLNAIAAAGGTGLYEFINADSEYDLETALNDIATSVITCEFDVTIPDEANEDEVNFYFDGEAVVYNEGCDPYVADGEGWMWVDEETKEAIIFCDPTCDELPYVTDVTAMFGCPTETP